MRLSLLTATLGLVIMGVSVAQTAPSTPTPSTAGSSESGQSRIQMKLAKMQRHEAKLQNLINSGKLTGDKLTAAQAKLTKIQGRIAKLQQKESA